MSTSPLDAIAWSPTFVRAEPALAAATRRAFGDVPASMLPLAVCPWLLRMEMRVMQTPLAHVPYELLDLVHLVVSQDNSCRYCYGAARTLLRFGGYSEARIRELETDLHQAALPNEHRLALEYVRRISRSNPRPGAPEAEALKAAGFTQEAVGELALVTAFFVLATRLMTLTAGEPDPFEKLPDKWYGALLRPLMGRMIRARRKVGQPMDPPDVGGGKLGELFTSLGRSPYAHVLADGLRECLESPLLPRRAKLLVFAVIGRTLQCDTISAQTQLMLEAEGLDAADVGAILTHLASPKLTQLEARLLPAARETVRYQTGPIQKRMRELSDTLPAPEFIEFVGVAALGNALARLSVLMNRC